MREQVKKSSFFVGGIPPFLLFEMQFHSLFHIVESHKNDRFYKEKNPASEIATIGLISQFEAFCKHQFAAIINIFPSTLDTFSKKRQQTSLELSTVVSLQGKFEKNVGFVIAEQYDFGTPKNINGLFRDLILVTPFDKDEIEFFNSILYRRNLLVHHAGFHTLEYLKSKDKHIEKEIKKEAFRDAVKIDTEQYGEISDFIFEMSMKIAKTTTYALRTMLGTKMKKNQKKAIEELLQGLYDTLDESA